MKMKYFTHEEFDSPDIQGSGQLMDEKILSMIDKARDMFAKPIKVNSGYRTEKHNTKIGGVKNSSHLTGLAIDISCNNSLDRFQLIMILMAVGFNRIGIASSFIHIDIDLSKSANVMWTY